MDRNVKVFNYFYNDSSTFFRSFLKNSLSSRKPHLHLTNSSGGTIDAPGSKEKLRRRVNKYFSNKRIRIRREVQFYFSFSPYLLFISRFFLPSSYRWTRLAAQFVSGAIFDTLTACNREKYRDCSRSERNSRKNWCFSTTTNSKRFESTR